MSTRSGKNTEVQADDNNILACVLGEHDLSTMVLGALVNDNSQFRRLYADRDLTNPKGDLFSFPLDFGGKKGTWFHVPGNSRRNRARMMGITDVALVVCSKAFIQADVGHDRRQGLRAQLSMALALGVRDFVFAYVVSGNEDEAEAKLYGEVKAELTKYATKVGVKKDRQTWTVLQCRRPSKDEKEFRMAFTYDNLTENTGAVSWYEGATLSELFAALEPMEREVDAPFRMVIHDKMKIGGVGTVVTGVVLQGSLDVGSNVMLAPLGLRKVVKSMEVWNESVSRAVAGMNVGMCLGNTALREVARGMVMTASVHRTEDAAVNTLRAQIMVINAPKGVQFGVEGTMLSHGISARVHFHKLHFSTDRLGNNVEDSPTQIVTGQAGEVTLTVQTPAFMDRFTDCSRMGRFVVALNEHVALAGKVIEVEYHEKPPKDMRQYGKAGLKRQQYNRYNSYVSSYRSNSNSNSNSNSSYSSYGQYGSYYQPQQTTNQNSYSSYGGYGSYGGYSYGGSYDPQQKKVEQPAEWTRQDQGVKDLTLTVEFQEKAYELTVSVAGVGQLKSELNCQLGVPLDAELQFFDVSFKDYLFLDDVSFQDMHNGKGVQLRVVNATSTTGVEVETTAETETETETTTVSGLTRIKIESLANANEDLEEQLSQEAPDAFVCPIAFTVYSDPVFLCDGYTYERTAIEDWLKTHDTSPMTNQTLDNKTIIPNYNMRSQIQDFKMQLASKQASSTE